MWLPPDQEIQRNVDEAEFVAILNEKTAEADELNVAMLAILDESQRSGGLMQLPAVQRIQQRFQFSGRER